MSKLQETINHAAEKVKSKEEIRAFGVPVKPGESVGLLTRIAARLRMKINFPSTDTPSIGSNNPEDGKPLEE